MMHEPFDKWEWHGADCDCETCCPPGPGSRGLTRADRIALQCLGGMGFGLALALIIDRLLGGPVFG